MRRVHLVRTKGEQIAVSFDTKGIADLAPRKERVWVEVITSFTVELSFKKQAFKSCVESAKNFRYDLFQAFVKDNIDEESVWERPPKVVHNYPSISQDDWERFIEYRRTPEFKRLSEQRCEIRKKSKYGSTGGRDGYRKHDQKIIHELLGQNVSTEDFSEQETQGSFESVGTNDILTKSLGNAEHSGRTRGQSKTVQELCAKHGINRETIAEETITPTVDQHNSFKANCTLNEKEAGASDLQPMLNTSKESQLFLTDLISGGDVLVAIRRAHIDCVLTNTVHGIVLGEENVRVTKTIPKLKRALLPIPTNEATCIEEVIGGFVARPKRLVVLETTCPTQQPVSGDDMPIYTGFEDVYHFVTFQEISANNIMVYISYLADCCARAGVDQRFKFISPVLVSPVPHNVDRKVFYRERANNILWILTNAPRGKLFLILYISSQHWILAVLDSWDDLVLDFNPLGNEPSDDFKSLIKLSLNDCKIMVGRGIRKQRNYEMLIDTVYCPIQEGYVECGYFVLAFMQEITLTVDGLALL
ncbi:hypothetical protein TIFTF001_037401 [Ficus carica]|uniref:Ubiquitin-like protease family profile domain-containing protein n=1 Tax=Ficus carica TaxID=3494 RepID=A0AA88E5I5_FICCA|nr:hypothetical protein TIFTF001_037401 [Ficus carica]